MSRKTQRTRSLPIAAAVLALAFAAGPAAAQPTGFFAAAPANFIPPPLHPHDTRLATVPLGDGVYALVSGQPAVDNSGFVVGEDGVLVIDAHINGAMARQIQDAVRAVTDRPIRWLVNTNYHGDHTFGNYAFPRSVTIVAHRETARLMAGFEREKATLLATVENDPSVFAGVELRLPDLTFSDSLAIDLGGRVVELHHFGKGNTPGDTLVWLPAARVAWTGNLVIGEGTIPPIFEGDVAGYLATLARLRAALDVATIVPGHGALTDGRTIGRYLAYLAGLLDEVGRARSAGASLAEVQNELTLARFLPLPPDVETSPAGVFLAGLHGLNLAQTYREVSAE